MSEFSENKNFELNRPRYELNSEESAMLIEKLYKSRVVECEGAHYVTFEIDGKSQFANIGRHIERTVFEEKFGNNSEEMKNEYGPYENASTFFISVDQITKEPIGVLRVIKNSQNGIKTINDSFKNPFNVDPSLLTNSLAMNNHPIIDMDNVWDIGTLAILPEHRSSVDIPSVRLYRAAYASSLKNGVEHWVSIVDDGVFKMLRRYFGIPFVPLAGCDPGPYLGSEKSHAVDAYVPDFRKIMGDHMAAIDNSFGKLIYGILVDGDSDSSIFFEERSSRNEINNY